MNNLLLMLDTAATDADKFADWGFAERAAESLKISGLGMGTVFLVLIILWGFLELFRIAFYEIPKRRAGGAAEKIEKPVKKEKPVSVPEAAPVTQTTNDAEIVAAIAAAIACMAGRPAGSFRVVSFRKTGTR